MTNCNGPLYPFFPGPGGGTTIPEAGDNPGDGGAPPPAGFHIVTFDPNYSGELSFERTSDDGVQITAPAAPVRTGAGANGYFRGWYKSKTDFSASNRFDFNTPIDEGFILYAGWGYKVSDTGPGGGIVFYVESNPAGFSNGDKTCYYLEAALVDMKNDDREVVDDVLTTDNQGGSPDDSIGRVKTILSFSMTRLTLEHRALFEFGAPSKINLFQMTGIFLVLGSSKSS